MAHATVIRAEPVEPPIKGVVLELNVLEAEELRRLLFSHVHFCHSRLLNIGNALERAGVEPSTHRLKVVG